MNTCLYTTRFKIVSMCSKVFVECILWFGNSKRFLLLLFQFAALTHEASPNIEKLERTCIGVSGTLTLWGHETLHILVATIS